MRPHNWVGLLSRRRVSASRVRARSPQTQTMHPPLVSLFHDIDAILIAVDHVSHRLKMAGDALHATQRFDLHQSSVYPSPGGVGCRRSYTENAVLRSHHPLAVTCI